MKLGSLEVTKDELDALLSLVFIVTQDAEICNKVLQGERVSLRTAGYRMLHLIEQGKMSKILAVMALYSAPVVEGNKIIFTLPISEELVEKFADECIGKDIKIES